MTALAQLWQTLATLGETPRSLWWMLPIGALFAFSVAVFFWLERRELAKQEAEDESIRRRLLDASFASAHPKFKGHIVRADVSDDRRMR